MRGPECCFSFEDLFIAAEGRRWTTDEALEFKQLSQDQKNERVTDLVNKAPQFITADRFGTDGVLYRAFWIPNPSN